MMKTIKNKVVSNKIIQCVKSFLENVLKPEKDQATVLLSSERISVTNYEDVSL